MLPSAAAAVPEDAAGGLASLGPRFEQRLDPGPGEASVTIIHANPHEVPGSRERNEDHPTVGVPGNTVSTRSQRLNPKLHRLELRIGFE